jgi:hypothetical protein
MIFEISLGAVLGYVGKEAVEYLKAASKEKREKRRAYFDKKLELTISSMRILSAIVIQLHNCALSLKSIKRQWESRHLEGLADATKIFIAEYQEIHKKAKEFPHEVTLFYNLPDFDALFGHFNEMLESTISKRTIPPLEAGNSHEDTAKRGQEIMKEIDTYFADLTSFAPKIENIENLLRKCLKDIRDQFRSNQ